MKTPTSEKSPRESPRAKRTPFAVRHIGAVNSMGITSFIEVRFPFALSKLASMTGLHKRTVLRCYDGAEVFPSTRDKVTQAARLLGLGEPPGSYRLNRDGSGLLLAIWDERPAQPSSQA